MVSTKFCTYHNSSAAMACAKTVATWLFIWAAAKNCDQIWIVRGKLKKCAGFSFNIVDENKFLVCFFVSLHNESKDSCWYAYHGTVGVGPAQCGMLSKLIDPLWCPLTLFFLHIFISLYVYMWCACVMYGNIHCYVLKGKESLYIWAISVVYNHLRFSTLPNSL